MRFPHPLPPALALGLGAAIAMPIPVARAGVWTASPELALSGEYSTNPQLFVSQAESGGAAVLNVGLPAAWDDGAREFQIAPRARLAEANGTSPIGRNGYYLTASGELDSERGSFGLNGRWADDSTAISEPAAGTLTRLDVPRHEEDATAEWKRALTPRLASDLSVNWQSVGYAPVLNSGLLDYHYSTASGLAQIAATERTQLTALVAASKYEVTTTGLVQNSQTAQIGMGRQLTEKWSASLQVGRSRVTSPGQSGQSLGAVYAGNLQWTGLTATMKASLTQSYQPSGYGTLALTREAVLRGDIRRTERLSGYLALRAVTERDSFSSITYASRSYESVFMGASWAASSVWDLSVAVNWQRQRIDVGDQVGRGVGAIVSASRKFGRIRLS